MVSRRSGFADPREQVAKAFGAGLEPDPTLTISEWADEYRVLDKQASDEAGRWRTDRTPYSREIMDCLGPYSPESMVVWMKGAQIGASETAINATGFWMDMSPGPIMYLLPIESDSKDMVDTRIDPMVRSCERLESKVLLRDGGGKRSTTLRKRFPGGILYMMNAKSKSGLRMRPVEKLVLDEVDAYEEDLGGEGDPVKLAIQRTVNFAHRKVYAISTPTIAGRSRIEKLFKNSDQRYYYVPCPLCGHKQHLRWQQLKWESGKPETVQYECESCGDRFDEHHKTRMLAEGEWIAHTPENRVRGYHLNSLYSPLGWLSWRDLVSEWIEAQGDTFALKSFVNTKLGEPWEDRGEAPDWELLYGRREPYKIGTVPKGGVLLTAGVDVQKDRLEVGVWAWGARYESWSVEHIVLQGDPAQGQVWVDLQELLIRPFPHELGGNLFIDRVGVDTGYETQIVYDWCSRQDPHLVAAVDGDDRLMQLIGSAKRRDIKIDGRLKARGVVVWRVGTDHGKSDLYARLRQRLPEEEGVRLPVGWVHFPEYGPEYFKQLTAEELREVRLPGGRVTRRWVLPSGARNEVLDCRVYARAVLELLHVSHWTPERWEAELASRLTPPDVQAQIDQAESRQQAQQRSSGYFSRWQTHTR